MKRIATLLALIFVAMGLMGCIALYGEIRTGRLAEELAFMAPETLSAPDLRRTAEQLAAEQRTYRLLVLVAVIVAAVLAATLAHIIRRPIITLDERSRQLEAKYAEIQSGMHKKNIELTYAAQKAESERSKYEAVLGSITDGMVITDLSGNIMLLNGPAFHMLGIPEEGWYGRSIFKHVRLYDAKGHVVPQAKNPIAFALRHGQKMIGDVVVRQGSEKRVIRMTATVIMSKDHPIGSVASLRDITHEQEVDRMKTEFISLASHQLRTPLSAIKWFSEMLLDGDAGKLKKEQAEYTRNIVESTTRMIDLVNSLLNISRIESGRIMVDPKPTDLRKLVDGILMDLEGKIKEKEHVMVVSVLEDLPDIKLDPNLIGQVYLNLLTNAIKYSPKGGEISVIISKRGDEIISQVSDTGYGIPKAEQAKMFQKFFRAENVAKVETDGNGLGMYLVKAIVESSGGHIWFRSTEGKGTTFWFSLPMSGMKPKAGEVTLNS